MEREKNLKAENAFLRKRVMEMEKELLLLRTKLDEHNIVFDLDNDSSDILSTSLSDQISEPNESFLEENTSMLQVSERVVSKECCSS